jgi:hypothetical protein
MLGARTDVESGSEVVIFVGSQVVILTNAQDC